MSTRSRIGYLLPSGEVKSVYCHHDGYVEAGVGHQLHTHHNSLTAAKAIVALGDLSSLYEQLTPPAGVAHSYDNRAPRTTVAYGRDRNEKDCGAKTSANVEAFLAIESGQEYAYLFKDGEWFVYDGDKGDPDACQRLTLALVTKRITS